MPARPRPRSPSPASPFTPRDASAPAATDTPALTATDTPALTATDTPVNPAGERGTLVPASELRSWVPRPQQLRLAGRLDKRPLQRRIRPRGLQSVPTPEPLETPGLPVEAPAESTPWEVDRGPALPPREGIRRLGLLVKDPRTVYLYWTLPSTPAPDEGILAEHAVDAPPARYVVELWTRLGLWFQLEDAPRSGDAWVTVPPQTWAMGRLCQLLPSGGRRPLLWSIPVETPPQHAPSRPPEPVALASSWRRVNSVRAEAPAASLLEPLPSLPVAPTVEFEPPASPWMMRLQQLQAQAQADAQARVETPASTSLEAPTSVSSPGSEEPQTPTPTETQASLELLQPPAQEGLSPRDASDDGAARPPWWTDIPASSERWLSSLDAAAPSQTAPSPLQVAPLDTLLEEPGRALLSVLTAPPFFDPEPSSRGLAQAAAGVSASFAAVPFTTDPVKIGPFETGPSKTVPSKASHFKHGVYAPESSADRVVPPGLFLGSSDLSGGRRSPA